MVLVPVQASCTLLGLWHHFGWAPHSSTLSGEDLQKAGAGGVLLVWFALVLCRGVPASAVTEASLAVGAEPQKHRGRRCIGCVVLAS